MVGERVRSHQGPVKRVELGGGEENVKKQWENKARDYEELKQEEGRKT